MFDRPEPLDEDTIVKGFTPDATLSWLVAYAGPCGEPACEQIHTRLYLIPMIGWLHATCLVMGAEVLRLRPAIMSSGGTICDFMAADASFKFIAVVRATEDAAEIARGLYRERCGGGEMIVEGAGQSIQN